MNLQNICDSVDDMKKLIMVNNCFSVKMNSTILAELCCLSRLSVPIDGFNRISMPILPGDSYLLFDNGLDLSPLVEDMQVRGIILCFSYPSLDADGNELEDSDKSLVLHLYDKNNNTLAVPACKTFSLIGNTVSSNTGHMLNKVVVENPGNFTLKLEGLLLIAGKDGVVLSQGSTCC